MLTGFSYHYYFFFYYFFMGKHVKTSRDSSTLLFYCTFIIAVATSFLYTLLALLEVILFEI